MGADLSRGDVRADRSSRGRRASLLLGPFLLAACSSGAPAENGSAGDGGPVVVDATVADAGDGSDAGSTAAEGLSDATDDADGDDTVLPIDTVLTPPVPNGPILGTVTGYEITTGCPMSQPSFCYAPLYTTYDRDLPSFWDNLVDEHLFSRVDVVMAHGRGCFSLDGGTAGNGNMCPRLLSNLVDAVNRAGAQDVYRVGMWDDTGAYQGARNYVDNLPADTLFDLADQTSWRFFWDYNMKIWHDTVPSSLWYRINGRPVVAFWSLASAFFTNQQGNASLLLRWLRSNFQTTYGEDPFFIVDRTWPALDTTITTDDAQGMNAWFEPPGNNDTYSAWNGAEWGAAVPGFRNPDTDAGCGDPCREVPRNDGGALRSALTAGLDAGSTFTLLEGWTDIFEGAGYYRSAAWTFPNQYIGIVREFADPSVATLRFQAEGADTFSGATEVYVDADIYRPGVTNIGQLSDQTGWYVDWTQGGGWVEFASIRLTCGTYRFTARVAAAAAETIHLEIDGASLGSVAVPATADLSTYELVHLATAKLADGPHTIRFVSDTGGIDADWFFLRRSAECP
jgi:hypothetical protein